MLLRAAAHEVRRLAEEVAAGSDVVAVGAAGLRDAPADREAGAELALAAWVRRVARLQAVLASEVPLQAVLASEVPLQVVLALPEAFPSAAVWVSRQDPILLSAPRPLALTARAMELSPIAWR